MKRRGKARGRLFGRLLATMLVVAMVVGVMPAERVKAKENEPIYINNFSNFHYFPQKANVDCGIASVSMIECWGLLNEGLITFNEDNNIYDAYEAIYEAVFTANGFTSSLGSGIRNHFNNIFVSDYETTLKNIHTEIVEKHVPVLIYRTGGRGIHWSVIVGYKGSASKIEESGFIVYNPTKDGKIDEPVHYEELKGITDLSAWRGKGKLIHAEAWSSLVTKGYSTNVPVLSVENLRIPENIQYQINNLAMSGLVKSPGKIISIETGVKNSNGEVVLPEKNKPNVATPNSKYFSLMYFDAKMAFGGEKDENGNYVKAPLAKGKYIYYVKIKDSTGAQINWQTEFTISSSSTTSKLSEDGEIVGGSVGTLMIGGMLDGVSSGNINGYGTVDIWIEENGQERLWKDDCSSVTESLAEGTKYRIDDIKAVSGKKYEGVVSGNLKGTIVANACVGPILRFSTDQNAVKTYPSIMLHVPYYPQKSTTEDDCAISAIAMIEGYARNYDKSKYSEAYSLVYRANGNQVAPSNVFKQSRYDELLNANGNTISLPRDLAVLYKCLEDNKPILIHREGGADHWSVIVGYNGSTTNLEVSGFVVWNTMSGVAELNYDEVLPVSANKTAKRGIDLQTWINKSSTKALTNVKIRNLGLSEVTKTGWLDLNGYLDGAIDGGISGFGTADVWINEDGQWIRKADDCADYYAEWLEGTKYRINDIKASYGKQYNGIHQGVLEGMITGDATTSVVLDFSTKVSALDLNGFLDGTIWGSLEGYGTADVWIYENGQWVKKGEDCGDYCAYWPVGTKYRINDIKPFAGKKYNGVHKGTLEGELVADSDTGVYLDFSTVSVSVSANLLELDLNNKQTGQVTLDYSNCPGAFYVYHDYDGNVLGLRVEGDQANQKQIFNFTALKAGTHTVTIRVANQANVELTRTTFQVKVTDAVKPVISEVWVSDLNNTGYTVNCRATDKAGIWYVAFPTWTDYNGQDDLPATWPSVSVPVDGVYSYRVNISDHNNESGVYYTHVYAYDSAGNYVSDGIETVVEKENAIHFDSENVTLEVGKNVTGHYWFTGSGIKSIVCEVEDPSICMIEMYEPTWSFDPPDGYMTIYGKKAGTTKVTLYFVNDNSERFYQSSFSVNVEAEEIETNNPNLNFATANLTLQDNLAMNFKVEKSLFTKESYGTPYVKFLFNGSERVVEPNPEYLSDATYYWFTCNNIAPQMIGDVITATLYVKDGGTEVRGATKTMSPKQYLYTLLGLYTSKNKLTTLLVDLLNYGAAAQVYVNYKTDALVNADLTAEQAAWGTAEARSYETVLNAKHAEIDSPGVNWTGIGLTLNETVAIRYKIDATDLTGLTVKVTDDYGHEWTYGASDLEATSGGYYLYFRKLQAKRMSDKVYATVYRDGVAVSNTLCYSIESYVSAMQSTTDANLKNLINAMIKYGDAAKAY